jgi:hypothetical protein
VQALSPTFRPANRTSTQSARRLENLRYGSGWKSCGTNRATKEGSKLALLREQARLGQARPIAIGSRLVLPSADDFRQLEDRQEHTNHHAAYDNTKEDNKNGLDERGQP